MEKIFPNLSQRVIVIIDEIIDNHRYIGTSILRIYQMIFWKKKMKILRKNSKNYIIKNNRHFKVIL